MLGERLLDTFYPSGYSLDLEKPGMVMGRGEPCCMLLRKSYVTPPVEMVVAWCSLGAGEGGAGERSWATSFSPFIAFFGEDVINIIKKP